MSALLALLIALTAGHVRYEDRPLAAHTNGSFAAASAEVSCETPWSGPVPCPERMYVMRSVYGSEESMPIVERAHELAHVYDGLDGVMDGKNGREDPHPWPGWEEALRRYPAVPGQRGVYNAHCLSNMAEFYACEATRTGRVNSNTSKED